MRECSHVLRSLLLPTGVPALVPAVAHMADSRRPIASTLAIHEAGEDDWPQIWPIIDDVITEQQTFAYDPAMSQDEAKRGWLLAAPATVVVAANGELILGTANMYANRPGPGSHVASGSLMVATQARGKGVGRALTTDMIRWARRSGFAAIQFNAVVDTNTAAVHLYESLGFVTLGTAPRAFRHPHPGARRTPHHVAGPATSGQHHKPARPYGLIGPTRQVGGISSCMSGGHCTTELPHLRASADHRRARTKRPDRRLGARLSLVAFTVGDICSQVPGVRPRRRPA
jgi:L-amino acid N-acyltransferase YncA